MTVHRRIILTAIFLAAAIVSHAQNLRVKIVDASDGRPIEAAIVSLHARDSSIVSYSVSDKDGSAVLSQVDFSFMKVALLGYRTEMIHQDIHDGMTVRLTSQAFNLKGAIATAPVVEQRGDTITYNVSSLRSKADRVIADVLEKIPGIDVLSDGRMNYMGKPVSGVYIDGNDILEHRYNLATKRLPVDAIYEIEVLEHHQPIRALLGLKESDKTAINLKLRRGYRNQIVGGIDAAAGPAADSLNYAADAFVMDIRQKLQAFGTAQADRSGNAINEYDDDDNTIRFSDELVSRYRLTATDTQDLIHAPIGRPRSTFNNSVSGTADTKLKTGKTIWGVSAGYVRNDESSLSGMSQSYHSDDGTVLMEYDDSRQYSSDSRQVRVGASAKINEDAFYMRERVSFQASDKTGRGLSVGNDVKNKSVDVADVKILNDASIVLRNSSRSAYTLSMSTEYEDKTDCSLIGVNDANVRQDVAQRLFYNQIYLRHDRTHGQKWKFRPQIVTTFMSRTFDSGLEGIDADITPVENQVKVQYFAPRMSMSITRSEGAFDFRLTGEGFSYLFFGSLPEQKAYVGYTMYPSLDYSFGGFYKLTLFGSATSGEPSESQLYSGYLLSGFRELSAGRRVCPQMPVYSEGAKLQYSNPLNGLYFSPLVSFQQSRIPLAERDFVGDYIIGRFSDESTAMNSFSASATGSKSLLPLSGKVSATIGVSKTWSAIRQMSQMLEYSSLTPNMGLEFNGLLFNRLNIKYDGNVSCMVNSVAGNRDGTAPVSLHQNASFDILMLDRLQAGVKVEEWHNFLDGDVQGIVLFDADASYTLDRIRFYVELRNLLNDVEYVSRSVSPLYSTTMTYRLRPRCLMFGINWSF